MDSWTIIALVLSFFSWTCCFFAFVYVRQISKAWREEKQKLEKASMANEFVSQEMREVLLRMKRFMETFEVVEEDDEEPG